MASFRDFLNFFTPSLWAENPEDGINPVPLNATVERILITDELIEDVPANEIEPVPLNDLVQPTFSPSSISPTPIFVNQPILSPSGPLDTIPSIPVNPPVLTPGPIENNVPAPATIVVALQIIPDNDTGYVGEVIYYNLVSKLNTGGSTASPLIGATTPAGTFNGNDLTLTTPGQWPIVWQNALGARATTTITVLARPVLSPIIVDEAKTIEEITRIDTDLSTLFSLTQTQFNITHQKNVLAPIPEFTFQAVNSSPNLRITARFPQQEGFSFFPNVFVMEPLTGQNIRIQINPIEVNTVPEGISVGKLRIELSGQVVVQPAPVTTVAVTLIDLPSATPPTTPPAPTYPKVGANTPIPAGTSPNPPVPEPTVIIPAEVGGTNNEFQNLG